MKNKLIDILRSISYPRRCGSEGEKRIQSFIWDYFNQLKREGIDFDVFRQEFSFSVDTARIIYGISALTLIVLLFLNISLLIYYGFFLKGWGLSLVGLSIILFLLFGTRWNRFTEALTKRKSAHMLSTHNIIARLNVDSPKTLVFIAHYDSKSGGGNFIQRIVLVGIACFLAVIVSLYSIVLDFFMHTHSGIDIYAQVFILKLNLIISAISFIIMVILAYFYFLKTGNESPGAIDNASGVSVLLSLASHFTSNLPSVNVWFVSTAAEEETLVGIVRFMDEYGKDLDPNNTFFINIDSVGGDGSLKIFDNRLFFFIPPYEKLPKILKEASNLVNVKSEIKSLPRGLGFDSSCPALRGFMAVSISYIDFDKKLKAIHTPEDVPDIVREKSLEETYEVCKRVVELI